MTGKKFSWHEEGLYCTERDCLRETPVMYSVVDLNERHSMVLNFGLCLQCAITEACEVPENEAGGVQIIVSSNRKEREDNDE